jgi:hypothetical protein
MEASIQQQEDQGTQAAVQAVKSQKEAAGSKKK